MQQSREQASEKIDKETTRVATLLADAARRGRKVGEKITANYQKIEKAKSKTEKKSKWKKCVMCAAMLL